MTPRGKLIAIEGIDGSGKRTQLDLLAQALEQRGLSTARISFPQYETLYGKLVARYLNGEFGSLENVDPQLSALLYAGNRLESKPWIEARLGEGYMVLADRYIGSNLAHQSARVPPGEREEFVGWLKRLEYGLYQLPIEDLILYLFVPATEAQRLVGMKSAREYTSLKHDIQEASISHLQQTALMYEQLADAPNWVRIDCTDPQSGALLTPEEIHGAILDAVDSRVLSQMTDKQWP
jgi:dTMP kinase